MLFLPCDHCHTSHAVSAHHPSSPRLHVLIPFAPSRTVTVSEVSSFTPQTTLEVTRTGTISETPVVYVTLPTYIATKTVTVTIDMKKRQVTDVPTLLPAYVTTACTGDMTSRYRSACSCLGVTPYAITVEAPVTTVTVTSSTSSTITALATVDKTETLTLNELSTVLYVLNAGPCCPDVADVPQRFHACYRNGHRYGGMRTAQIARAKGRR